MKQHTKFAALGQDIRLKVFRLLIAEENGMSAGDIASQLQSPPSTLSSHLKVLEHAELIQSRRQSQKIIYSVNHQQVRQLVAFLVDDCCNRQPDLCGLEIK